jgi:hypothetical protein
MLNEYLKHGNRPHVMSRKYWDMLPSLSGPLGLGQSSGHHGLGGGFLRNGGNTNLSSTQILKLHRIATGGSDNVTEISPVVVIPSSLHRYPIDVIPLVIVLSLNRQELVATPTTPRESC